MISSITVGNTICRLNVPPSESDLCPYLQGQRPEGLEQTMSRGTTQTTTREQTSILYYKITVKYYSFYNHISYETILSPFYL